MQLAAAGWQVIAVDQSQRRVERMQSNLGRTGLDATIIQADLTKWAPDVQADAILLDAPCSATGIFRRHPDVIHRVGPRQIAEMAELQAALLDRAAGWLKPGGRMVYATCSLEAAEGEDQISALMARDPAIVPLAIDPAVLPEGISPAASHMIRTLPGTLAEAGGLDGFFIALTSRSEPV